MFLFRGLCCLVGTPPGMGQLIAACVRIQREWQVYLGDILIDWEQRL
jgi:hypothetical protein